MIPILMQNDTVVGFLADALSCVVTEERNGVFELSLTYPVTGGMFPELQIDRLVKAKPNDTADLQLFRIYEVSKPMNGIVTVNAEHVSYALASYPVTNVNCSGTASQAVAAVLAKVNTYLTAASRFQCGVTSANTVRAFSYLVGSARAALGGTEGSVLDTFGGEYEWDNYTVRLHEHRGSDTGVVVAYRKNMTDVKVTTSLENAYTALFPYALKDDVLVTISGGKLSVTNNSGIAERILIRDFSHEFDEDEEITAATLKTKAQAYLSKNDINAPDVSVTVSFVHLWQSPEYAELEALEKVSLCDWITVRHEVLGVDVKAQVVKTVYDTIAERYEKLEIGSARANFQDTLQKTVQDVTNLLKNANTDALTQAYMQAIADATELITGADGGYVHLIPSNNPQQIVISDIEDYTSSSAKVWRWNKNGLGYSSTGFYGTYATAITKDGKINASMITTGSMNASMITGGILQSVNGVSYFNLQSGIIKVGGDSYYTYIADGHISQYLQSSGGQVGGMVPIGSGSDYALGLYYCNALDGVALCAKDANDSFITVANFKTNRISFYADALKYFYRYRDSSYTCLDTGPSEFRVYTFNSSAQESTERFSVTSSLLRVDVTSRIALYANMDNNDGGYITVEKGKMELCDGTNYRTLEGICSSLNSASSTASSALSKANDAYSWADVNSSNIDTLWDNVLWKNGDCSVDCIRFNGGDIAFQVYNGALSFGIAAKPMDFWATRYNFVNDDVRIGGTSLKQWIKNNLTPKSGGGWA